MTEPETTIPKGSWVLVTGATGFVASHVTRQFLERGYRVRGTVRDQDKASWLVQDAFKSYADSGHLQLVVIPDLAADHAFDEAIKGVSAVAAVATISSFDPDPHKVVPQTVAGITSILHAALAEPSVKEIVYTGSIAAAVAPFPGLSTHVEHDTWNEQALELAWAPPPYEQDRGMAVYWASKVEAAKAILKFAEEKKPHFNVNIIDPATILGEPIHKTHVSHFYQWVKTVYNGDLKYLTAFAATIHIDVKDVALLHVAAVLDPEVKNARMQAWGDYFNWNDMLHIMRRLYPDRKFIDDIPGLTKLAITADHSLPLALYNKWGNQDGWRSLEETVADNMEKIVEWYP
ncbi:hypothetical protein BX600DRAFT_431336 [Xylariales sp. PMI_506]|nr:hypothetical protein BX600DRAFT_431336 [Xylariales sp. PMI_506]